MGVAVGGGVGEGTCVGRGVGVDGCGVAVGTGVSVEVGGTDLGVLACARLDGVAVAPGVGVAGFDVGVGVAVAAAVGVGVRVANGSAVGSSSSEEHAPKPIVAMTDTITAKVMATNRTPVRETRADKSFRVSSDVFKRLRYGGFGRQDSV